MKLSYSLVISLSVLWLISFRYKTCYAEQGVKDLSLGVKWLYLDKKKIVKSSFIIAC